jgi:hypothetical protein
MGVRRILSHHVTEEDATLEARTIERAVVVLGLALLSACSAAPYVVASSSSPAPVVIVAPSEPPSSADGHDGSRPGVGTVRNVLALSGRPLDIAAGDGAVFTIVRSDEGATPIRLNPPRTGTTGAPITLDGETPVLIAYTGGAPWIATKAGVVARLDPASLVPTLTVRVAADIRDVASSPGRLWAMTTRTIDELDASNGEIKASYRLPARITRFAVSPDGTRLYAALSGPVHHEAVPIIELDAATGSFMARTRGGYADLGGVSGLTATSRGVWIAAASGNMGSAVFARVSDLRQHDGEAGLPGGPISGTNAIQLWLAGHRLWEFSSDGSLSCLDAWDHPRQLGYVAPEHSHRLGVGGVVSIGQDVWTGSPNSIDLLVQPRACRRGTSGRH